MSPLKDVIPLEYAYALTSWFVRKHQDEINAGGDRLGEPWLENPPTRWQWRNLYEDGKLVG